MYLLFCISGGFAVISLSLLVFAILWPEMKGDEAHNLLMQVRSPVELIGMRGRCVVVHWHTAIRYYRYKWSVYRRISVELLYCALASSLLGSLCAITAGIIKLLN